MVTLERVRNQSGYGWDEDNATLSALALTFPRLCVIIQLSA
jgi:hypothetical protein